MHNAELGPDAYRHVEHITHSIHREITNATERCGGKVELVVVQAALGTTLVETFRQITDPTVKMACFRTWMDICTQHVKEQLS